MSTYADSKIRKARKMHKCDHCGLDIHTGDYYLAYKLGLKWTVAVHMPCTKHPMAHYHCLALDQIRAPT